ncbi:hypothetical protein WMY93_025059 [Mugilogobius chulae]|uniref:Uncharacterized protein n=1 Tax=Mugilogobius chulae TaxID=88201 RepID=A0AAW0NDE0_9GOBI
MAARSSGHCDRPGKGASGGLTVAQNTIRSTPLSYSLSLTFPLLLCPLTLAQDSPKSPVLSLSESGCDEWSLCGGGCVVGPGLELVPSLLHGAALFKAAAVCEVSVVLTTAHKELPSHSFCQTCSQPEPRQSKHRPGSERGKAPLSPSVHPAEKDTGFIVLDCDGATEQEY